MKHLVSLLILFMLVASSVFAGTIPPQTLIKGQSTTLNTDYEIGEVAMTDQTICDYFIQDNRREIYLNPKKDGRTTLTLWDANGLKKDAIPITIISVGVNELLEDARSAFADSGTLKFSTDGDQVVITGEVATQTDLARLNAFAQQFPKVKNEARLAKAVLETITGEIEKAIATPGIRVRNIRDRIVLEGTAYNADASSRAEKIAKLYDENVLNLITVKDIKRNPLSEKLIHLDVHFMEVKKNALRLFGINWAPGSMPAGGGGTNASVGGAGGEGFFSGLTGLSSSLIGFVFNLVPKIKFARQKGDARVLENPSFLVKSGETADFFSGTQVPFYSQETVVFKDIGVKIQAEPISSAEDVDLKINVTVTSPTAGGVNKGIDTNTISTTAYCKAGSSLALAGIFRNNDAKMYNRIPEDTNTASALFTLFLSKDFLSNRSEFVIFVTPRIIDSPSNQANITTVKLEDWDNLNEKIIKKRSGKEYKQYMREKYGPEWKKRSAVSGEQSVVSGEQSAVSGEQGVEKENNENKENKENKEDTKNTEFELPDSLKNNGHL